jgi:hypothetical protein
MKRKQMKRPALIPRSSILLWIVMTFLMADTSLAQVISVSDIGLATGFQDTVFGHHKRGRAGIAADFDLDGYIDYYIGNPGDESFILRNVPGTLGERAFEFHQTLVTDSLAWGGVAFDYDNDGDYDIFISCGANEGVGLDFMFRNDWIMNGVPTGVLSFTDVTAEAGVAGPVPPGDSPVTIQSKFTISPVDCGHHGSMPANGPPLPLEGGGPVQTASANGVVADYDRDGDNDLFVNGNHMVTPYPELTGRNTLWRNNGDGTFTDATYDAGLGTILSPTRHSTFLDYDNDGDPDLYENNFGAYNILWRNNGDGTFTDVTIEASAEGSDLRYPWYSFVSASADLNNDGWEDLLMFTRGSFETENGSPYGEGHAIYLNHEGVFENFADLTNLNDEFVVLAGVMGCMVADVSGDGLPDIYIGNGGPNTGVADQFFTSVPGSATPAFEDKTSLIDFPAAIPAGFPEPPYPYRTHGTSFVDIDNDGILEIAVVNGGPAAMGDEVREPNRLFKVTTAQPYSWIKVRPVGDGVTVARDAIGTRMVVEVSREGGEPWRVYKTLFAGSAFSAQNGFEVHFGLSNADSIHSLTLTWPDGHQTTTAQNLALNSSLIIQMDGSIVTSVAGGGPQTGDTQVTGYMLAQNHPNPFNPTTTIRYSLPEPGGVNIAVYDILGRKVATLVDEFRQAGEHSIVWNGTATSGEKVSSGLYVYRMQAGGHLLTQKMVLMK